MTKNLQSDVPTEPNADRLDESSIPKLGDSQVGISNSSELTKEQPKNSIGESEGDKEIDDGGWLCL